MPPESKIGSAADWLKRARSNLALARQPRTEEIFWEDLCFETQQAAEKALKAVMIAKGIRFRFVHDLAELITLLENNGLCVPEEIKRSVILTGYAVDARYPGPAEAVTEEEFREALSLSEAVVNWAEELTGLS